MAGRNKYENSFASSKLKAKEAVTSSLNFIKNILPGLTADDTQDIKLILCELLYNAVIHGNKEDLKKKVTVSVDVTDNIVLIVITDEGSGFNYSDFIMQKSQNERCIENLFKESGRGIRLVMSLADKCSFNSSGNQISITKKVTFNG